MPDWITSALADAPLTALLVASFLAATLLPGGSEVVLAGYVIAQPQHLPLALGLATLGNTLGGATSYLTGRFLPVSTRLDGTRALGWARRYGSASLVLSWVPLIGDILCVAAGWLRLPFWPSVFWMALGKLGRYCLVAEGVRSLAS